MAKPISFCMFVIQNTKVLNAEVLISGFVKTGRREHQKGNVMITVDHNNET